MSNSKQVHINYKVGDRVRVYGLGFDFDRDEYEECNGTKGLVVGIIDPLIRVTLDDDTKWNFHPKQCRKIKKKEPRRVWINIYPSGDLGFPRTDKAEALMRASQGHAECVEFVEAVRRKK